MLNQMRRLYKGERGVTGLETAIILIAFVVVASVFAYTVLSAGIFTSQKGQEAIYSGMEEARSTLVVKGAVIGKDSDATPDSKMDKLIFTVAVALGGESVDMTPPTDTTPADGLADTGSNNVVVVSYVDENVRTNDLAWTKTLVGKGDSDSLLEPGERMEVTVDLDAITPTIGTHHPFTIEVKPPRGSTLTIERTTPANIDIVMNLR